MTMTTATPIHDAVASILAADDVDAVVARANLLSSGVVPGLDDAVMQPLLDAAALVGIARKSVDASASFTRARKAPRPVPGVERATDDPFVQTLLGQGHVAVQGAHALLAAVAREADDALAAAAPVNAAALRSRSLRAFEIAARVALEQGERVWEVVGTSGSRRDLGFEKAWTYARVISLRHGRAERQRVIAHSYLAWANAYRQERLK
jgi:alkylation response protein AidB-like acyl-CoA dehydrogenase